MTPAEASMAAQMRRWESLRRWRARVKEREKLQAAGVPFEESNSDGIVYIRTKHGVVAYKLARGMWVCNNPGKTKGTGIPSLKKFMEQG